MLRSYQSLCTSNIFPCLRTLYIRALVTLPLEPSAKFVLFVVGEIINVADVMHMEFIPYDFAFLFNGGCLAATARFRANWKYASKIIAVCLILPSITAIRSVE